MQQVMEQQLSPQELQKLRNNRTGLFVLQVSWILVFVSLIVINLATRVNYPSWPPPGVSEPPVALPIIATLALFGSSVLVQRGYTAFTQGNRRALVRQWTGTLLLGLLFIAIITYEWLNVPENAGLYGQLFRLMTAFHAAHALAIGLFVLRTLRRVASGAYDQKNFWTVEATLKLWHFVTLAWTLFFVVLYII
ncbi:MAG: cytochrome c oxidase subunit 3 [Chloroflexota bacterium]|nr:MAG: hypothetical protein DIU68_01985 [Chloroflexota bacterium]